MACTVAARIVRAYIAMADLLQGGVGNCWMLSAMSALAEFNSEVEKLFLETSQGMPMANAEGLDRIRGPHQRGLGETRL